MREAIIAGDADVIGEEARLQVAAGADFVDANAGTDPAREAEDMAWLVATVQAAVDKPVCIESPSLAALRTGLEAHRGRALLRDAVYRSVLGACGVALAGLSVYFLVSGVGFLAKVA